MERRPYLYSLRKTKEGDKMNELEVVKFLAEEVALGNLILSPNDETGEEYWQFKTPNGKTPYTCIRVADFDPMNDISHAFMVVDSIQEDIMIIRNAMRASAEKWVVLVDWSIKGSGKTASEAICTSIVRALAAPAQIEEMGL